jgi:bifunctional DNA-binding transcriptional regulator/antitoxin component of YhaV-PrlF toxin-antitoxin module
MSTGAGRNRESESLFSTGRQVFSGGSSDYFCLPGETKDILNLEKGDTVVLHEVDSGDIELSPIESAPKEIVGSLSAETRKIQGRVCHPSLFCNAPKKFNFDAGDRVEVVVYRDRIRIQPAEH